MTRPLTLPIIPAAFFGMVLGLAGLGNAWRAAHAAWQVPAAIGEAIEAVAAAVWAILIVLFALKWLFARAAAQAEAAHPIQCCFIGLAGVSTMLIAIAALPYSRDLAESLYAAGAAFTLGFGVWRTGLLWRGGRDPGTSTPVLYLPTVAGTFVMATGAGAFGWPEWGELAFGSGLFSWLAIDSVLLNRFYTGAPMPVPLRPTFGVQLAPPAVGAVAYLSVNGGAPDLIAHAMIGYGILQALLMLRMLPWIAQQPFAASYWAFSFGVTALATAPLRMVAHGDTGAIAVIAPWLFAGANLTVAILAIGTLWLLMQRQLLPPATPAAAQPAPAQ
jgi:tellurite resistance protein